MQAKDIPDQTFIDAVDTASRIRGFSFATRWDVGAVLSGYPEWVGTDKTWGEAKELLPQKLIIAKARKLIRRKVISGCICGCRGGFQEL